MKVYQGQYPYLKNLRISRICIGPADYAFDKMTMDVTLTYAQHRVIVHTVLMGNGKAFSSANFSCTDDRPSYNEAMIFERTITQFCLSLVYELPNPLKAEVS